MTDGTSQREDPATEWSELLRGLAAARYEVVVAALRHSASSGRPAPRDSVVSLIAYAEGRITAREYAVQTLVALGYADARTAAALIARPSQVSDPSRPSEPVNGRFDASAGSDFLFGR